MFAAIVLRMTLEPEQLDFASLLFPGRKMLYVGEVAERLEVTEQHVRDLIDEGKLHAIDAAGGTKCHWRIPVTSFERFLKERSSMTLAQNGSVGTAPASAKKISQ